MKLEKETILKIGQEPVYAEISFKEFIPPGVISFSVAHKSNFKVYLSRKCNKPGP